jgi:hypothetical protein
LSPEHQRLTLFIREWGRSPFKLRPHSVIRAWGGVQFTTIVRDHTAAISLLEPRLSYLSHLTVDAGTSTFIRMTKIYSVTRLEWGDQTHSMIRIRLSPEG